MKINTVTVIGANGTMGCNVAAIFASFGNAKVFMISRRMVDSEKAIDKAVKSVRADSIRKNLIPADYSMLEACVAKSDFVFESVKEDFEIKKQVTRMVAESLRKNAIACTGSSGLSVTALSECFLDDMRKNYYGVHMFNPPYNMSLCELTATKYSDDKLTKELKRYLSETLRRTVVEVKDYPAFLGNRIGFQFINEAMQYAEKFKDNGGIDYIDSILGCYTGRTMAPLVTSDFVGLDVHKAIVDNLYYNTNDYAKDTFVFPNFANKLVEEGKLGRKTGGGLYQLVRYDNGLKRMTVYDVASGVYRDQMKYVFPFAEKMVYLLQKGSYEDAFRTMVENHSQEAELAVEFLLKYVMYSLMAAQEVGYDVHAADDVMATGFNWCPPLAVRDALSLVTDFDGLVKERLKISNMDVEQLLKRAEKSHYDYRIYFKAKH